MNMRRVLAGVAATAVLVTSLIYVMATRADLSTTSYKSALTSCSLSDSRVATEECIAEVWLEAYQQDQIADFTTVLSEVTTTDPLMSVYCHTAGHIAGEKAISDLSEGPRAISRAGVDMKLCGNGFVHGVLDEFGGRQASVTQYEDIVRACSTHSGLVGTQCADGVGHSAFIRSSSVSWSTGICLMFSDGEHQVMCMAGVIMQMVRINPYTGKGPYLRGETITREIVGVCDEARKAGATENMLGGCYREVFGPAFGGIETRAQAMLQPGADRSQAKIDKLARDYNALFATCGLYRGYEDSCATQLATTATWHVANDPEMAAALCGRMDEKYREPCKNSSSSVSS